jgi:hypothetical protein
MAFNPLKNKKPSESEIPYDGQQDSTVQAPTQSVNTNNSTSINNSNINNSNDSTIHATSTPAAALDADDHDLLNYEQAGARPRMNQAENIPQDVSYEGVQVSELQNSGVNTQAVLNAPDTKKVIDKKNYFNTPLLESTPLDLVLRGFGLLDGYGGTIAKGRFYKILNQEIILKENEENRWYNRTEKTGYINAISLAKHLIAIKEGIDYKSKDNQGYLFREACKKLGELPKTLEALEAASAKNEQPANMAQSVDTTVKTEKSETASNNEVATDAPVQGEAPKEKAKKPFINWKELNNQLRNIPVNLVVETVFGGYMKKENWKIPETNDTIAITGQLWNSWKSDVGGEGALSLVEYYICETENIDKNVGDNWKLVRSKATQLLLQHFQSELDTDAFSNIEIKEHFNEPFCMPHVLDFKINQVRNYLHEKRGLPLWLINKQIGRGFLFAGFPSDWTQPKNLKNPDLLTDDNVWATFLSANGSAAEMRAIARSDNFAKLVAKGSVKEAGGYVIKAESDCSERSVAALEAAVDSMSYHAIYPGRNTISCMGVTYKLAAQAAIEALQAGGSFNLAFDNDMAGNEAAVNFRDEMITEVGEEEYKQFVAEQKIRYFDLAIRCLREQIEQGQPYYFDVKNNDSGRQAAIIFQQQLFQVMEKNEVKHLIEQGLIKYANVCPEFIKMKNPEQEAQSVIGLLNSTSPYYLRIVVDDDEQPDATAKREAFEKAFDKLSQGKREQWEKEGKIIYKKEGIAKDWNEYFNYMKNKPEFKAFIQNQEEHYAHYNTMEVDNGNGQTKTKKVGFGSKLKR